MPKNQVDAKKFFWVPKISPGCQKTTFWHPRMPHGNAVLNSKFQFLNLSNNQSIECRKLRRNFQKTMSFLNTEGTTADSRTERQRGWRGQSRLEADCCKENRAIRAAFCEISDKTIEPLVV